MNVRSLFLVLVLMTNILLPSSVPVRAAATLELYGTFHAMGVIVTLAATDDPDEDAIASVEYRTGSEAYHAGFPLSRVSSTRFVGSLFWLTAGTAYDVRVTLSHPDGVLNGDTVSVIGSTRAEIVIPAPSHSYYVSPSGSGTTCSLAVPCSLTEGLGQAQPGEEVVLRGGVYYRSETLPRSGTSGAPIVVKGYPGETAVLDGADPAAFTWTDQGGGVWRTTVNASDPHLVLSNGQRLYPYQSLSDLQNLRWGIPGFYANSTSLYVRLAGDANPSTTKMVVSRYESAFYVDGQSFIYFLNLTFRHYGLGDYGKAIYFDDAGDNLVQDCTFAVNDLGIGIKRDSHRNVIQDNTFYDVDFEWPWDAVKAGSGLETGGIRFYDPATGRGNVIRRNTFHDYFDGLGVCPGTTAGLTNETDVYENLIYNAGDDGMETDGQCSNVRIWGNTFYDVLSGISLAPVYTGPVYAIRNLIYRTGVGNSGYPGLSFKFNSGYDPSGPMYLFHNTADAALPGSSGLDIESPGTWKTIYARNNIWSGTEFALSNANPSQPLNFDHDDLYTTLAGELVWWDDLPDHHLNTLAEFQAATGQEMNGLNVVPGFANAASGDYALDSSSDLIDAGAVILGINDDYVCAAPDVGAFEYQGYGITLSTVPSSQAIMPGGVATYTIGVQPVGGFSSTVTLTAASPSPDLTLQLAPMTLSPSARAVLTVTDGHSGTSLLPGLWYTIPITATGGGVTQNTSVGLLVGGERVWLPVVLKSYP